MKQLYGGVSFTEEEWGKRIFKVMDRFLESIVSELRPDLKYDSMKTYFRGPFTLKGDRYLEKGTLCWKILINEEDDDGTKES